MINEHFGTSIPSSITSVATMQFNEPFLNLKKKKEKKKRKEKKKKKGKRKSIENCVFLE